MKLINPILITINSDIHIKANNLDPVRVDDSCVDKLIDDVLFEKRKTRLLNEIPNAINLLEGINISELADRIEVKDVKQIREDNGTSIGYSKRAFLLPEKEDKLIVGEDMICPITKEHCDDECCPVGAQCNMGGKDVSESEQYIEISDPKYYTTEEAEADKVVEEKVELLFESVIGSRLTKISVLSAIQDRQSVLDALVKYRSREVSPTTVWQIMIEKDITSITKQIKYLKTKL